MSFFNKEFVMFKFNELIIRSEKVSDNDEIRKVIIEAFKGEEISDNTEHLIVERTRKTENYLPELTLVAVFKSKIIGHLMISKIKVLRDSEYFDFLALAPVSVLPKYQKKGVGSALIKEAHKRAQDSDFPGIILLGHENYYPRFGYQILDKYDIKMPFDVPLINQMIFPIQEKRLKKINGKVEYPPVFFT